MVMEFSIFFARLWGSFFIIFGLLFIITRQLGKTIEMTDDKAFVISTGYITMLMGLVTVLLHNVWTLDWRVVITVLAWSTLIKGISKIGWPEQIHKQAQRFKKKQWLSAFFIVALGVWLFLVSFGIGVF
jgi:glucose uptake protein GlcU